MRTAADATVARAIGYARRGWPIFPCRPGSKKRRHGMHSLRHTLATRLMENGTPVEQIADILGHQSVESTGVYSTHRRFIERLVDHGTGTE